MHRGVVCIQQPDVVGTCNNRDRISEVCVEFGLIFITVVVSMRSYEYGVMTMY